MIRVDQSRKQKDAAQEEGEDVQTVDATLIDGTTKSSQATAVGLKKYRVKTKLSEKAPKQIDLRLLSSSELASLKDTDPFMYHSIPEIKKAVLKGEDVDLELIELSVVKRCSIIALESATMPSTSMSNPNNVFFC